MKNDDVFNLPLRVEYDSDRDTWVILNAFGKVLFYTDNGDQADAIVHSINEYDKLRAEKEQFNEK